jgi:hypothetical protein
MTSIADLGHSKLSPPLMPRFKYRHSTPEENRRSQCYLPGRPVLDLFTSEQEQPVSDDDLSFLAIPTPPSNTSEIDNSKIPSFGLSPRTTMAPSFPLLLDSRRLFGCSTEVDKENVSRRRILPPLRMRPQRPQLRKSQLLEELALPTLADVTAWRRSTRNNFFKTFHDSSQTLLREPCKYSSTKDNTTKACRLPYPIGQTLLDLEEVWGVLTNKHDWNHHSKLARYTLHTMHQQSELCRPYWILKSRNQKQSSSDRKR